MGCIHPYISSYYNTLVVDNSLYALHVTVIKSFELHLPLDEYGSLVVQRTLPFVSLLYHSPIPPSRSVRATSKPLLEATRPESSTRTNTPILPNVTRWRVRTEPVYSPRISFYRSPDFRTQLSATDYGNFLANEPLPISTSTIADKATELLVDQFNYLRGNAVEPLRKFLDYVTFDVVQLDHLHNI